MVTTVGGITLAVGFAHWLLGSRLLLAAALSSFSLWHPVDPVPVLAGRSDDEDDEDDDPAANEPNAGAKGRFRAAGGQSSGG